MEEKELVTNVTENVVEQATEQIAEGIELTDTTETVEPIVEEKAEVKTYTDEDVDKILAKKIARIESKLEKKYQEDLSKYKTTESVLNAGLGTSNIDDATQRLTDYYKEQGIVLPEPVRPGLSDREIEILAKAEAEDIIEDGIEEMTKEADRMASIGYKNLSNKEKVVFNTLAERLTAETKKAELVKNGIKADILEDKEFKAFASDFNPRKSIVDIYQLYTKTKEPIKEIKPIGSMATTEGNKVKDFYSYEEMQKLTDKDYDDPKIRRAVDLSLEKLYKESH